MQADRSDGPSKRSRGRPPKGPVKKIKREEETHSNTQEYEDVKPYLNQYDIMHREYIQLGMAQTSQIILRRAVQHPEIPPDIRCQKLLRLLLGTMEELDLNEIETALWAIYLEKLGWSDNEPSLQFLLYYAAFAAKSYLNDDVKPYEVFLSGKVDNFKKNYEKFMSNYGAGLEIVKKDLNKRLRELSKPISIPKSSILEYNFYVDDILALSPPYREESKPIIKELIEDKEIRRTYKAYKTKKEIIVKEPRKSKGKPIGKMQIPSLERLDSTLSNQIEHPVFDESSEDQEKNKPVVINPNIFDKIDSLCNDYANNEFTPICSPPPLLKKNSLLNGLASH